jgi:hypothetical protein
MKYRRLLCWLLVIAYASLIFYLSSLSDPLFNIQKLISLKLPSTTLILLHMIEYLILSILLYIALKDSKIKNPIALALLLTITYSFTDEIHQLFVPGRHFDILDILNDSFGTVILQSIITIKNKYIKMLLKKN